MVIVYNIERGGSVSLHSKTGKELKYTTKRVHYLTFAGKDKVETWKFNNQTNQAKRTAWQKQHDSYVNGKEEAKQKLSEYRKEKSRPRRERAKAKTQERKTMYHKDRGAKLRQSRDDAVFDDPDR